MRIEFEGEVFRWTARVEDWFFVALPEELSAQIREVPRMPRGFGAVRVRARVGGSLWTTSIFPDSAAGAYVLPLKRVVRDAEGLELSQVIVVGLELLDG